LAEEDELPRLALVSRLFYTFVLDIERQGAKESLEKRLAWIHRDVLPPAIEKCDVKEVQNSLSELQQKLDSAFASNHFTNRTNVVKKRHEVQKQICQITTKQLLIGKAFCDSLTSQANAFAPDNRITCPYFDIVHTLTNRRIMQLFLYANACNNLKDAKTYSLSKQKALGDMVQSHRLEEALALFKNIKQETGGTFVYDFFTKYWVILLVKLLKNAKRSSDVEFVYNNLNDKAKEEVATAGATRTYKHQPLAYEAHVWKTADEAPDPYLTRLINEL